MPNRIIKESICRSSNLDRLSAEEERFFYRLLVQCDDYGRYEGRAAIIKGACFPLKPRITTVTVDKMLASLRDAGLIFLYVVDGLPYIQVAKWEKHQQIRAQRSKYPEPNGDALPLLAGSIIGDQPKSLDSRCPRNPIQSESNPNLNPIQEAVDFTETDSIIDYLNEQTQSDFKHSKHSRENIHARLADGLTADECKLIIDYKCREWLGDTEWEGNLNPVTLFRPKKYENNLNAARRWATKGRPSKKPQTPNGRPLGEYDEVVKEA